MNLQNEVVSNDPVVDIETLKDTCPLTQTEITNVSTTISKFLAFYINKLQNEDTYREIIFPNEPAYSFIGLDPIDMLTDNRIKTLLKYIRKTSFNVADTPVDDPNFNKLMWVVSNFDYLFQLSASKFLKYTGVTINAEEKDVDDQMSDELIMLDSTESKEEDGREPYAYDARETPVMVSMQQGLKTALSLIPEKEIEIDVVDGRIKILKEEKVYDETFGNLKFLDENVVIGVLYNKLHLSEDRNEMLSILKDPENIMKYPWFLTIYRMLINSPELTTRFYTTFRKNKTNYVKTDFPRWNWKTESREANNSELLNYIKLDKVKSTFITNVTTGNTELFIPKKGSVIGESELDREVALLLKDQLKEVNNKQPKEKIKIISKTLRYLGFGDYEYNLKTYKDGSSINALHFHLSKFIDFLLDADRGYIIPYLNTINGDKSPISQIYSYLVSMTIIEAPVSAYDKGKNYQVWTPPSFLGDLIGHINKDGEENVTDFIDRKYGKSKQTAIIKNGEFIEFVSSWLNIIKDNPKRALEIRHLVETSAFDKQYKEMGISLYPLSTIIEYFAPRKDTRTRDTIGRFPVPTMSDKPASEYIEAFIHAFTNSDAKDRIAEDAVNFVIMEINRIRTVLEDAVKNRRQIDNYSPKIPRSVLNKFKKHTLTIKDFSEKGNIASWMEIGGARFQFFTFFNDALINDKEFSENIISYFNYKTDDDFNIKLTPTIKKIFKENMEEGAKSFKSYIKSIIDPKYLNSFILCRSLTNEEALEEYYWNYRLGAANILALTIIDPAFYKDATDLQKRFAQVHSMTDRCDIYATFIDEDGARKRFSEDGLHRFLILEDLIKPSDLKTIVSKFFDTAIHKEQNESIKKYLIDKKNKALPIYDKVIITDSQAFSSPEGFFKKLGMLGLLTEKQKQAFFRLRSGEFNSQDIDVVFQPLKPFVYDWENQGTEKEPFLVPIQLKDSEAMLAITGFIAQGLIKNKMLNEDSPLFKLFNILHNSAYKDGKWNGKGIDTIVFESAVKCGASNTLTLKELENLNIDRIEKEGTNIGDYLDKKGYIHSHNFYSWGKQQKVPANYQNHERAMPSQTRILSLLNIKDESDLKFRGRTIKGKEFKKRYFDVITDEFNYGIDGLTKSFGLNRGCNEKTIKLSQFLIESLNKDENTTAEQLKAVLLNNGKFNIPLGDPINTERYANNIFHKIKHEVNKIKIPGGPIVQTTCYGFTQPKINLYEDGSFRSIGIYITIPTKELEKAITNPDGTIKSKEEIIRLGIMKEEDFYGVSSRIPVEAKYSMFPIEIMGFLPRSIGEVVIFPEDVTIINGSDFDIDKAYIELKYLDLDKKIDNDDKIRKNLIVDLQFSALSSNDNIYELLSPQNFSPILEIISLINTHNKNSNIDMTMPEAQYYYQHLNMTNKDVIAIAASSNIAHGSLSLCNINIKAPNLSINGKHFYDFADENYHIKLDPEFSYFDGSYISDYIALIANAATDNDAKYILPNIGLTNKTAAIFIDLLRIGIPFKTVALLMSQPIITSLTKIAETNNITFYKALENHINTERLNVSTPVDSYHLNDSELILHIKDEPSNNYQETISEIISILINTCKIIYNISKVVKLNSTQNAVGPDIWKTLKTIREIESYFTGQNKLLEKTAINSIYKSLPFIKPLVKCYTDVVPNIMIDHFTPFSNSFIGLLKYIDKLGIDTKKYSEKKLRNIYNEFMIYLSTGMLNGKILIDASFKERERIYYYFPSTILNERKHTNNLFLNTLKYLHAASKDIELPVITLNTTNLSSEYKDSLSSYWADLVQQGMINISNDLIKYNIFRSGFFFSPNGFLNLAPTISKKSFHNNAYIEISKASNWDNELDESDYENFIKQRIRNNYYDMNDFILDITDRDEVITDTEKVIVQPDIKLTDNIKALKIGYELYLRINKTSTFKHVSILGFGKQGFEYNRLEDSLLMKTVRDKKTYKQAIKGQKNIK